MTALNTNQTPDRRSTYRKAATVGIPVGLAAIFGVGCIDGALGVLLQLLLVFLGATPADDFGQSGQVEFAMVPMTGQGEHAEDVEPGSTDDIEYEVECDEPAGTEVEVDDVETKPSEEFGTFTILLDGSGSMERTAADCPGCPYDKDRRRVEAAKLLSEKVIAKAPGSRMGLFEFTAGTAEAPPAGLDCDLASATDGFMRTRTLQTYTEDVNDLFKGADQAYSCGGTYLYDSLDEVLASMNNDIQANFQTQPISKAIIVITDGEDTASQLANLESVIAKANSYSIPVHVVGLGAASEVDATYNVNANTDLIADLRDLASKTGGFYASAASADELVSLADTIAAGLTGGYEAASVTLKPVPPSGTVVTGRIRAKYSDGTTGPWSDWSFVAP